VAVAAGPILVQILGIGLCPAMGVLWLLMMIMTYHSRKTITTVPFVIKRLGGRVAVSQMTTPNPHTRAII
jgi:hypothetical protein